MVSGVSRVVLEFFFRLFNKLFSLNTDETLAFVERGYSYVLPIFQVRETLSLAMCEVRLGFSGYLENTSGVMSEDLSFSGLPFSFQGQAAFFDFSNYFLRRYVLRGDRELRP